MDDCQKALRNDLEHVTRNKNERLTVEFLLKMYFLGCVKKGPNNENQIQLKLLFCYHYRPITVPLPFLASVTHSPSS
jgi:hypothetical protein